MSTATVSSMLTYLKYLFGKDFPLKCNIIFTAGIEFEWNLFGLDLLSRFINTPTNETRNITVWHNLKSV